MHTELTLVAYYSTFDETHNLKKKKKTRVRYHHDYQEWKSCRQLLISIALPLADVTMQKPIFMWWLKDSYNSWRSGTLLLLTALGIADFWQRREKKHSALFLTCIGSGLQDGRVSWTKLSASLVIMVIGDRAVQSPLLQLQLKSYSLIDIYMICLCPLM